MFGAMRADDIERLLDGVGFGLPFSRMGQIALIASIVSYIGAGLMLVQSIFGFVHLRRALRFACIS
jgi:Na+-transporting NADH:ubiquinone oxidoreductase subunit NqrD